MNSNDYRLVRKAIAVAAVIAVSSPALSAGRINTTADSVVGSIRESVRYARRIAVNDGRNWPTLHGDLTRSGYYPHFPTGPLTLAWRKDLHRELTGPRAEVIVGAGMAFMGAYSGRIYAWDARTGEERWFYRTGGPIGHSPALTGNRLYVGSMDRRLTALDARTGKRLWSHEAGDGIWSSPSVHDGKVMFGARDGVFTALFTGSGKVAWRCRVGGPILNSPSVSEDGTRVLFVSEDMRLYCLDVQTGRRLWRSRKMAGVSARDYFPVIASGIAMVTTAPVKDFHAILGEHERMLQERTGFAGPDSRYIPGTQEDVRKEQDFIIRFLRMHPAEQTFYAFRVSDGKEPWIAPILYTGGLHNPMTPPTVHLPTGNVFVLLRSAYGVWDGGGEVRSYTTVGRLDLSTGRVALIDHSYRSNEPGRPAGARDMPWMTFNLIGDETQALSCSTGTLFSNHQGYLGSLDLRTGRTAAWFGKRDTYGGFFGPGTFGWESEGGEEKAQQAGQPYGIVNEWHGPARAIASVANGRVYYSTGSQVICLTGSGQ